MTPTPRFLNAFYLNPSVSFESQRQDEKVILMLRAHPIIQLIWIFNVLVLFLLLILLNIFVVRVLTINQLLFINIAGIAFLLSYIFFNFLNWYYNVGIVTNQRIVDIDFSNIIYKEVNSARLDKVEDITSKSAGYFGSLFNFGTVFVQTAGESIDIEFQNIPDPSGTIDIINSLLKPS